jgi:Zn-dependent protease with chaperone function
VPVRLVFARLGNERGHEAGFNAFALPHGAIVVLDGLAERLSDDELLALLGHELGHVQHRHGLRAVARGFGLLAVAGAVFGDFSIVVAGAMAGVQNLHYSRDAEREADAFSHRFAAAAGLPPQVTAGLWRKLLAEERRRNITGMPLWLSTHPSTEERLREAEARIDAK